jgi:ankyrin repeat protein
MSFFNTNFPSQIAITMKIPLASIGPEFDRLKNIKEICLHKDLLKFVEEAHLSLQSSEKFKRRDRYKRSLLHYAAMGNCIHLLRYLLQSDPKIDSRDRQGRTPLSLAAEYGSLDVVKILIHRGADINAMDYEDSTPLGWLIHAGNSENKNLAATEDYLREIGAREDKLRGVKRAWIWVLTYSRLLGYIRPSI